MLKSLSKRYYASLSIVILGLLLCVIVLNCAVDPLWYFRGNVITKENFAFNERLSKLNHFFEDPHRYDCLIFGSSRTTLFDEHKVEGHSCFNFAFSDGRIGEFVAYASYLKKKSYRPKLIIVAVDGFNFFSQKAAKNVPGFISDNAAPPSFLQSYLTLDALAFSMRTLLGFSPLPRYYKTDFSAGILDDVPRYDPTKKYRTPEGEASGRFYLRNVKWYENLMQVYPHSRFVFYVPPVSVWRIRELAEDGNLDNYLRAIYSVSRIAAVLYDFSIPSYITADVTRTYDGSHYDLVVNGLIARTISSGAMKFGIEIKDETFDDYKKRYLNALDEETVVTNLARHTD